MGKHTHKYVLKILGKPSEGPDWSKPAPGKYLIYACTFPDCSHYVAARLAIGKSSVCWVCGEKCVIPPLNNKGKFLVRPHCESCTRVYPGTQREKSQKVTQKLKDVNIEDLFAGLDTDNLFSSEE